MSKLSLFEGLLLNLRKLIPRDSREYLPVEKAVEMLRYHTGKDFGNDASKWEEWIKNHPGSVQSRKTKRDLPG